MYIRLNNVELMKFGFTESPLSFFLKLDFEYRTLKPRERIVLYYIAMKNLSQAEPIEHDIQIISRVLSIKEKNVKKLLDKLEFLDFITILESHE